MVYNQEKEYACDSCTTHGNSGTIFTEGSIMFAVHQNNKNNNHKWYKVADRERELADEKEPREL